MSRRRIPERTFAKKPFKNSKCSQNQVRISRFRKRADQNTNSFLSLSTRSWRSRTKHMYCRAISPRRKNPAHHQESLGMAPLPFPSRIRARESQEYRRPSSGTGGEGEERGEGERAGEGEPGSEREREREMERRERGRARQRNTETERRRGRVRYTHQLRYSVSVASRVLVLALWIIRKCNQPERYKRT